MCIVYVCMYLCTNSKCCCCGSAIHGAQMVSHDVQLKYILLISYTGNSSRKTSLLYSQRFLTFLVCPIEEPCRFWTFHLSVFFARSNQSSDKRDTFNRFWITSVVSRVCYLHAIPTYFLLRVFCFQCVFKVEQWKYHFTFFIQFACNCECVCLLQLNNK